MSTTTHDFDHHDSKVWQSLKNGLIAYGAVMLAVLVGAITSAPYLSVPGITSTIFLTFEVFYFLKMFYHMFRALRS